MEKIEPVRPSKRSAKMANVSDCRSVLIIDDEENTRYFLSNQLGAEGYSVKCAANGREGLGHLSFEHFDIVLCDIRMPSLSGLDVLKEARIRNPDSTFILMTAFGSIRSAVDAIQSGAFDYITKPFRIDELLRVLRRAEEHAALRKEISFLRDALGEKYGFHNIIGKAKSMQEIFALVKRIAETNIPVLIQGETGTGKELLAKATHFQSSRRNHRFVAINCGALPEGLQESELFGHVKGAFTDARADKPGLFELAHRGTLFLDEIGELAPNLQVKLLRVLEDGEVRRVGGTEAVHVDVRVLAATNVDLEEEMETGGFRKDLFFRLNVVPIRIPPLRERREDIPLLADHFLREFATETGRPSKELTPGALKLLLSYDWPGNVRELKNILDRASISADSDAVEKDHVAAALGSHRREIRVTFPSSSLPMSQIVRGLVRDVERDLILRALSEEKGNRTRAARRLGISHRSLLYKIKEYGLGFG